MENRRESQKRKQVEQIVYMADTDISKCMKCGKCSASCPAFESMDIAPHRFISGLQTNDLEPLLEAAALWQCLSCFTCIERCPRGVKPGRVIEACRQFVIRQQGQNRLLSEEVPELLCDDWPAQLLAGAFRKYKKA